MPAAAELESALRDYPVEVKLTNGRTVLLRAVEPGDKDTIVHFAQSLPESDLLFLRVDITKESAVDNWLNNVASGVTASLLAFVDGEDEMVGYATVDRTPARWTRRVGELRVTVGPEMRGQGLGRELTARIFDVARNLGLRKIVANMTADQLGAQAAFKRLGFVPEALLTDHVEDRAGGVHDLVVMSHDVDGLSNQAGRPLKV